MIDILDNWQAYLVLVILVVMVVGSIFVFVFFPMTFISAFQIADNVYDKLTSFASSVTEAVRSFNFMNWRVS